VEEELARCDPDQRPNHILLFTILNAQYTIDVSILYKAVLRIRLCFWGILDGSGSVWVLLYCQA
jgi:hypothetical protein